MTLQKLLLSCLFLFHNNHTHNGNVVVDAFASYMVQNIGCMTDLSTDEVIMNAPVVAAAASDHPEVSLKLAHEGDAAKVESIGEGGKTKKHWIDTNAKDHPDHVYEDAILLELKLDYDDSVLKDLQFLVETSFGASMVNGQCDDEKRVAARSHDSVKLKIPKTTTVPIQVWAGWATGHEQVRLTPVIEFQLQPAKQEEEKHVEEQPPLPVHPPKQQQQQRDANNNNEDEQQQDKQEMVQEFKAYKNKRRQEEEGRGETSSTKNKNSGHQKEEHHRRNHRKYHGHPQQQQEQVEEPSKEKEDQQEERILHEKRNRFQKDDRKKEKLVDDDDTDDSRPKNRQHTNGDAHDKIKERQRKWVHNKDAIMDRVLKHAGGGDNSDDKLGIQMDTTWFLYGMGILLLGNLVAIKACIFVSQSKKGGSAGGEAKHV